MLDLSNTTREYKNDLVEGKDLARWARFATSSQLALGAVWLTEDTTLVRLTRAQAAAVTGASPYAVAIVALTTAEERTALDLGAISMAEVRRAHAHPAQPMTDAEVLATIHQIGINRVWSVFDQATAPEPVIPTTTTDRMPASVLVAARVTAMAASISKEDLDAYTEALAAAYRTLEAVGTRIGNAHDDVERAADEARRNHDPATATRLFQAVLADIGLADRAIGDAQDGLPPIDEGDDD